MTPFTVKRGRLDVVGIEMPGEEAVTLRTPQPLDQHLVEDAFDAVVQSWSQRPRASSARTESVAVRTLIRPVARRADWARLDLARTWSCITQLQYESGDEQRGSRPRGKDAEADPRGDW